MQAKYYEYLRASKILLKADGSPMTDSNRKQFMVNVWVGKKIGPKIDELAEAETIASGRETTRIQLVKEIFSWALPFYQAAGSLAALKKISPADIEALGSLAREVEEESRAFPSGERKKPARVARFPQRKDSRK